MAQRAPPIAAIDLVRFAAALLVVAHHYLAMLPLSPPPFFAAHLSSAAAPVAWAGWVGVEIFFVVSGCVIAISAERGSAGAFLRRRALRLAPAAWIAATLTTSIALLAGIAPAGELLGRWASSVVFWPLGAQADPSYWTLGIECSFYLLISALLTRPGGARAIEPLGVSLILVSAAYWGMRGGWSASGSAARLPDLLLLTYGAFFGLGILLWRTAAGGWSTLRTAALIVGLAAGICEIMAQSRFMASGLGLDAGPALPLALFTIGFVTIACAARLQRPLARLGLLSVLGAMTYPLYLIHQRAGAILIDLLVRHGVPGGLAVAVATVAALGGALWIAVRLEPALRRWLAARLDAFSALRDPARDTPRTASPPAG